MSGRTTRARNRLNCTHRTIKSIFVRVHSQQLRLRATYVVDPVTMNDSEFIGSAKARVQTVRLPSLQQPKGLACPPPNMCRLRQGFVPPAHLTSAEGSTSGQAGRRGGAYRVSVWWWCQCVVVSVCVRDLPPAARGKVADLADIPPRRLPCKTPAACNTKTVPAAPLSAHCSTTLSPLQHRSQPTAVLLSAH